MAPVFTCFGRAFTRLGLALLALGCAHGASASGPNAAAGSAAQTAAAPRVAPQVRFVSSYAYEWFIRAELMRARGDLRGALGAYRRTLSDADEDPYVLARLATALDEHGERPAAESALNDALELDPASEAAWLGRGEIAERHGEVDAALRAYERAESSAPSSFLAPRALASLLRQQHQDERAIAVLERYEARTLPGSLNAARARLRLALLRKDGSGTHEAARAWLAIANAAEPELLEAARALLTDGEPTLAWEVLSALPERSEDAELRLAVLLACGKPDAAETLLATTPPEALGGLLPVARAYEALGRDTQALALAQLAHERDPSDPRATRLAARLTLQLAGLPALAREVAGRH